MSNDDAPRRAPDSEKPSTPEKKPQQPESSSLSLPLPSLKRRITGGLSTDSDPSIEPQPVPSALLIQRQRTLDQAESSGDEPPADNDDLPPFSSPSEPLISFPGLGGANPFLARQQTVGGENPREEDNEPPADDDELPPLTHDPSGNPLLFQRQPTVNRSDEGSNEPAADGEGLPAMGGGPLVFRRQPTVDHPREEDRNDDPPADGDELPPMVGGLVFQRQPTVDPPASSDEKEPSADSDELPPVFGSNPTFMRQNTETDVEEPPADSDELPPVLGVAAFQRQPTVSPVTGEEESPSLAPLVLGVHSASNPERGSDSDHSHQESRSSSLDIPPMRALYQRSRTTDTSGSSNSDDLRELSIPSSRSSTQSYLISPDSSSIPTSDGVPTDNPLFNRIPTGPTVPSDTGSSVPTDSPLFNRVPTDTDPHGDTIEKKIDRTLVTSPATIRSLRAPISPSLNPVHSFDSPPLGPIFNRLPTETNPHGHM